MRAATMFSSLLRAAPAVASRSVAPVTAFRTLSVFGSSMRMMSAEGTSKADKEILDYFLSMDEKDAKTAKAPPSLPIKVTGISGGLATDLYLSSGKNFPSIVSSLQDLVAFLDSQPEVISRFFKHANYSPAECRSVLDLLSSTKESLKKYDAIKDDELREVIVVSPDGMKDWIAARKAFGDLKLPAPVKASLDELCSIGRLDLVRKVASVTNEMIVAESNSIDVTVSSAVELSAAQKTAVQKALPQYAVKGQNLNIKFEVDEDTLGGLMVTLGNKSIDLTAGARLMDAMQE